MQDLGTLGGTSSGAGELSMRGARSWANSATAEGSIHAVLWERGSD